MYIYYINILYCFIFYSRAQGRYDLQRSAEIVRRYSRLMQCGAASHDQNEDVNIM
jgi:hypothetical protein